MSLPVPFDQPPNSAIASDPKSDSFWRRWFWQLYKRILEGALGGDVVGPSSSTDNAVARFDGATGKLLQNSGVIIDDSNNVTIPTLTSGRVVFATTGGQLTTATTETANTVFAGPTTGAAATPAFRALVAADIPSGAASLKIGTTPITSGTIGRLLYEGASNLLQESANLTFDGTTLNITNGISLQATPDVWGATLNAVVQHGDNAYVAGTTSAAAGQLYCTSNIYYDGANWKYKRAGFGVIVSPNGDQGIVSIYTAPSGAAGGTATITEQVQISVNGIGVKTGGVLETWGTNQSGTVKHGDNGYVSGTTSAAAGQLYTTSNIYFDGSNWKYKRDGFGVVIVTNADQGIIQFYTAASGSAGATATIVEQSRIVHTASASRYITLTGSNGSNPTIGTSAGDLAVSANIAAAGNVTAPLANTVQSGIVLASKGASGSYGAPLLNADVDTSAVGNVGGGEDTLITYTLPASSLSAAGKGVRITVWGTSAANSNSKTINMYFGTTVITTTTWNSSGVAWWSGTALVFSTGTDAQTYSAQLSVGSTTSGTPLQMDMGTSAQDDGATITIKCTGTATSNNDVVQKGLFVEFIN